MQVSLNIFGQSVLSEEKKLMAKGMDIKAKITTSILIVIFGTVLFALGTLLSSMSQSWSDAATVANYSGHAMVATLVGLLPFLWYAGVSVAIVLAVVATFF
jgi:heme/copper-type cytochrome/quinol oxidase subunit 2